MLKELVVGTFLSMTPTANADTVPTQQQHLNNEAFCLAQNIYFEARNQPLAGQLAVVSVTINRVNNCYLCHYIISSFHARFANLSCRRYASFSQGKS